MKYATPIVNQWVCVRARKAVRLSGACLGLLLFCSPVFAQLNYGRILGGVTDQSGGAVAGAKVEVIDVARGISHPLTTDGAGEYNASSLLPGTYTVRAEATGFKTIERQNVLVEVGQDVRVDLTVQPGEQTQTVTVTESVPVMNTTNAQLGGVLENQAIADLPLNGREFQKLLIYRPGVRANGLDIYVNGNRANDNMWLLDGLDNYNQISSSGPIAGGQSGFDQATILPVDAIQEVNVVQSPKAEYGWKPGSENNVGLKSGTNSIHGTASAFGRNRSMDARNWASLVQADDELEQFGATIGGPIKKDKLFYFLGFEGQRYTIGSPHTSQIPTTASGPGAASSFPDAITALEGLGYCNPKAAGCAKPLSQLSLNLAGCTLAAGLTGAPTCNASAGLFPNSTGSSTIGQALDNVGGSDSGIAKVDYHFNEHNSFNAEYFLGEGDVQQASQSATGDITNYWRESHHTRGDVGRAVWVWTPNSAWLNELRTGYEAQQSPQGPTECNNPASGAPNYATAFGFVTGITPTPPICGFPLLTISSFFSLGAPSGQQARFWTASFLDSVSYTRGKHLIKFGGEMHFSRLIGVGIATNAEGSINFGGSGVTLSNVPNATALEFFLAGVPSSSAVYTGNEPRHVIFDRYASFVQDDWRITSNVIVNLGVRWEYVPPIVDHVEPLGNFDPTSPTGLVQQGIQASQLYHISKRDFAPRLGVAWDITGKGTTVLRAGYSIVYNNSIAVANTLVSPGSAGLSYAQTGNELINAAGTVVQAGPGPNGTITSGVINGIPGTIPWAVGVPIFPGASNGAIPVCGNGIVLIPGTNTKTSTCAGAGIDPNHKTPYVSTWNLSLQHAFTNTLSLNVAYIGDRGTNLDAVFPVNQPPPGVNNSTTQQQSRPYYSQFPWFGNISVYESFQRNNYNALNMTLTQRAGHGLNLTAGYSFSHALDNEVSPIYSANPNLDYGPSVQDPRQNFSLTASYNIPGRKAPGQMLEGWRVNTVVHILGGVPFNSYDSTSGLTGNGASETWTLIGNARDFATGTTQGLPCFGVSGSTFAKASNAAGQPACITVANMPTACITAATNEPVNPTLPAGTANATGLLALNSQGCYYKNGSVIVPPAQGTFGTMTRSTLRGAAFSEWDMSVTKSWKFKERLTAEFRAESFNLLNHTQFAQPSGNPDAPGTFGISNATPNSNNPVVGEGGPRQIQFGLKLIF
jgi:Carboxypeptidase regulatory-like domain/TonB dependent receptor